MIETDFLFKIPLSAYFCNFAVEILQIFYKNYGNGKKDGTYNVRIFRKTIVKHVVAKNAKIKKLEKKEILQTFAILTFLLAIRAGLEPTTHSLEGCNHIL